MMTSTKRKKRSNKSNANATIFPARVEVTKDSPFILINLKKQGDNTPPAIQMRNIARLYKDLYFSPISIGAASGKNNDGDPVPINVLGRWLFGAPGYKSHILVTRKNTKQAYKVHYPAGIPKKALTLLRAIQAHDGIKK